MILAKFLFCHYKDKANEDMEIKNDYYNDDNDDSIDI